MPHNQSSLKVSIVVITFNSTENIKKCLEAVQGELQDIGGELIIFDNNSTDTTCTIVEQEFKNARLIRSAKNIGFARGVNRAAAAASGEDLLFLNPDMILDRGAIQELLNVYTQFENVGAVTARMKNSDGTFQPSCRNFPTMHNVFGSRGSVLAKLPVFKSDYTLPDYDKITEVPSASATCLLIHNEYFKSLGGFDERFFMFMEDTDLCMRISQTGRKVYFNPKAGGRHYWGSGANVSRAKRLFYHHHSVWKYFLKYYPNGFSLFMLPIALFFNFLISMIKGRIKNGATEES
ncbi:MAG: glycosyltransferase family 2 protein [Candidatus Zixiibacteriota bacterium]